MRKKLNLSPAIFFGLGAFTLSAGLALIVPTLSIIPLAIFIIACLIAPFFPRSGFFLPVIYRGNSGKKAVAITFDDGPDPLTTPLLLQLLSKYDVTATFFIVGAKAKMHPLIIRQILSSGHSIGNHTFTHDVMIMLKSSKKLRREIASTQTILKRFGIIPFAFRPPAGIVNPRLWSVLKEQHMFCLNYSCRGLDAGNRRIKNLSKRILSKIGRDDILLLHDVSPRHPSQVHRWLNEIECILKGLSKKGLCVIPLAKLIDKEVMQSIST